MKELKAILNEHLSHISPPLLPSTGSENNVSPITTQAMNDDMVSRLRVSNTCTSWVPKQGQSLGSPINGSGFVANTGSHINGPTLFRAKQCTAPLPIKRLTPSKMRDKENVSFASLVMRNTVLGINVRIKSLFYVVLMRITMTYFH
uniref:Uncharacterized protein n=1 Tax=Cannabis sativa TaxID=3483 RepID=A0A803QPR5_CANSA